MPKDVGYAPKKKKLSDLKIAGGAKGRKKALLGLRLSLGQGPRKSGGKRA